MKWIIPSIIGLISAISWIAWRFGKRQNSTLAQSAIQLAKDQNAVRKKYQKRRAIVPNNWDDVRKLRSQGKKL